MPSLAPAPLLGLARFLARPGWWLIPIVATALAMLATGLTTVGIAIIFWPDSELSLWSWAYWAELGWALGAAGVIALVGWFALLPLLLSFAYEGLIKRVFRAAEVPIVEERPLGAVQSALVVFVSGIGWMIFWPIATLLTALLLPILSPVVGQMGLAHGTCLAAIDSGLALRGRKGVERVRFIKEHRGEIWGFTLVAALVGLPLALTVIGWVAWLPGLFVGVAMWLSAISDDPSTNE